MVGNGDNHFEYISYPSHQRNQSDSIGQLSESIPYLVEAKATMPITAITFGNSVANAIIWALQSQKCNLSLQKLLYNSELN